MAGEQDGLGQKPMFIRIWRYRVRQSDRERFEAIYRPDGDWARLFDRSASYLGTELLRGEDDADGAASYVTIDRWRSGSDWLRFRDEHDEDYRALDRSCEALTDEELEIGDFTQLA